MSTDLLNKVLRVGEGRAMKGMQAQVARINALEPEMQKLCDEELAGQDLRVPRPAEAGETIDDLLDRGLRAGARARRGASSGMRLYDVQLIGAMALQPGQDRRDEDR